MWLLLLWLLLLWLSLLWLTPLVLLPLSFKKRTGRWPLRAPDEATRGQQCLSVLCVLNKWNDVDRPGIAQKGPRVD